MKKGKQNQSKNGQLVLGANVSTQKQKQQRVKVTGKEGTTNLKAKEKVIANGAP